METFSALLSPCARSPRHRGIPLTKGQWREPSMLLCCQSEQTVEQTFDQLVIDNAMTVIWRRRDATEYAQRFSSWIHGNYPYIFSGLLYYHLGHSYYCTSASGIPLGDI